MRSRQTRRRRDGAVQPQAVSGRGFASGRRGLRGFTAIELTAVAAIIAILSLVLIPTVRNRVRQSRIVAAQDDMRTLETAAALSRAEANEFFRLNDLDNPAADLDALSSAGLTPAEISTAIRTVPNAYWNRTIPGFFIDGGVTTETAADHNVVQLWNGPYTSFPGEKGQPLEELVEIRPAMFRIWDGSAATGSGPILVLAGTASGGEDDFELEEEYPVDPWGNPYIFFGPEPVGNLAGDTSTTFTQVDHGVAAIFSMGPDGIPGSDTGVDLTDPGVYFREAGHLGTGDDLVRTF